MSACSWHASCGWCAWSRRCSWPSARCSSPSARTRDNALVAFVLNGADLVDLGVFSRQDGIKQFTGPDAATKNALFNWGLGAIVWLVVGRILDRIVRP